MSVVSVKICGLKRPIEAERAAAVGADYVGLVFAERLRRVSLEEARAVVETLSGPTRAVGVFVDATADEILRHRDAVGFSVAQLHGSESRDVGRTLGDEGLGVWKALRPTTRDELAEGWRTFAGVADAILVEGFSLEAAGGTGSSFPYDWLKGLDRTGSALVLAGGLNVANVADAVTAVRPDVVDVSSGVEETPGVKSLARIEAFIEAAKRPLATALPPVG
ncbi:MAG: phosphoribosylanthranilate isomerase [Gemmatimonadetes bacterium]|nr:phosphoribosylanthranilate isomerase [Gemmatimonadota bacterium]